MTEWEKPRFGEITGIAAPSPTSSSMSTEGTLRAAPISRRASNLQAESRATHDRCGISDPNRFMAAYARNYLLGRRLLERGAGYVTLYCALAPRESTA